METFGFAAAAALVCGLALPVVLWVTWRLGRSKPQFQIISRWSRLIALAVFLVFTMGLSFGALIVGSATVKDIPVALAYFSIGGFVLAVMAYVSAYVIGVLVVSVQRKRS